MDLAAIDGQLREAIRDIPDFPRPGVLFRDVTTLLRDRDAFRQAVQALCAPFRDVPLESVVAIESRGFPFGAAMSYELGCGLILARKPGKLPAPTERASYALEYGEDALEVHRDAIAPGHQVLVVDDVLATGGTARAGVELVRRLAGVPVGLAVLLEITSLDGRAQLGDLAVHSVLKY